MNRAYAVLEIKAAEEAGGKRTFRGIATTPATDSYGDIVEPKGAEFELPIPLLWQHDSRDPIGWVTRAKVTASGIEVEGEVAQIEEEGELKQRLATAWQMLKAKLVRGLSIGFNSIESSRIDNTYAYRYVKWRWLELSAVTIPANHEASITAIKSADTQLRAASGNQQRVAGTVARSAHVRGATSNPKGLNVKTLQELMEARTTKTARSTELIELRKSENRKFSPEEAEEFDALGSELDDLEDEIRMKNFEARMVSSATRVDRNASPDGQRASRGGTSFVRKNDADDSFKGQSYVRTLIAKACAMQHGPAEAMEMARKRWGQKSPKLVEFVRAVVAGGGTGSGEWGAELAQLDTQFTGDFIEFLYAKTVFDQLGLRSVPARIRVRGQDGAFTGYWVGESKAIPMSKGDYSEVDLTPLKVAALTVISMELLEDSQPSAEMLVRDGLVEASSQRVDQTFLSTTAISSGVSPAGILNGVTAITPSGTDLAAVRNDLTALMYPFVSNKMASGITLVMNPATGLALSMMYGALDQPAFPDINENGGTLGGRRVVVGDNVTPGNIIAIRAADVWRIGDSGVQISMSREATIEQRDDPTGATDTPTGVTTTGLTNMFQEESVAFKVVRRINFQKRRSTAVQYLQDTEYGGVVS